MQTGKIHCHDERSEVDYVIINNGIYVTFRSCMYMCVHRILQVHCLRINIIVNDIDVQMPDPLLRNSPYRKHAAWSHKSFDLHFKKTRIFDLLEKQDSYRV
jgi:hypothetical protein